MRAPDAGITATRVADQERRRMGYAAMMLPQTGSVNTTGTALLGN